MVFRKLLKDLGLFNLLEIKKPSCDGQFMFCNGGGDVTPLYSIAYSIWASLGQREIFL